MDGEELFFSSSWEISVGYLFGLFLVLVGFLNNRCRYICFFGVECYPYKISFGVWPKCMANSFVSIACITYR